MNKGTLIFWITVAVAVSVFAVVTVFRMQPPEDFQDPAKMPKPVTTAVVRLEPVVRTYTTQGTVEAASRVDMNVETPGTIAAIHFHEGQAVRKGQVLIRLRADKQAAQRMEASAGMNAAQTTINLTEAEVSRAEANLDAARAAKELAESEYNRYDELYKKEFVSALELDQKRTAYHREIANFRAAQEALSSMKAQLGQSIARLSEAQARLAYSSALTSETTLYAPFTGIIGQKFVDLGDYVMPGEKVVTVVDNSRMRVAFNVPERYLGALEEGLAVRVRVEGFPEALIPGQVDFISPAVNLESRTVTVKALLDRQAAQKLRAGQFATVNLALDTRDGLVIPEQALIPQGEKYFVYVAKKDGTADFREVRIGVRETGRVQITAGLKRGEKVVVSGVQKLFDGAVLKETSPEKPGKTAIKPSQKPQAD